MDINIQRLAESALLPTRAHSDDAGLDLYASESVQLAPGERVQVKTGIAVAIPSGYVGLIWDKSGLSHKAGLKILGGVVDSGYRGEVLVGIVNLGSESHTFKVGDKVAQMLIQKVERAEPQEVATLEETTRGDKGFGSTGV